MEVDGLIDADVHRVGTVGRSRAPATVRKGRTAGWSRTGMRATGRPGHRRPQDSADGRAACRTADDDSHSCQGMPSTRCRRRRWSATRWPPGRWCGRRAPQRRPHGRQHSDTLGHTGPVPTGLPTDGRLMHRLRQSMPAIQGQLRGPLPAGGHQVWLGTTGRSGSQRPGPQQNEVDALDARGADDPAPAGVGSCASSTITESQVGTHRLSEPGVGRQRGGHRTEQPRRVEAPR